MSEASGKPVVAIVDSKNLRRAGIVSLLQPWADAQSLRLISFTVSLLQPRADPDNLRLISFTPDQIGDVLHADTKLRMMVFSIGGESVVKNLQQLRILRALAPNVPLVIISDSEGPSDVATACDANVQGFLNSGIPPALALQALTFILNGGSYYPPSAVRQMQTRSESSDKPQGSSSNESGSENDGNGSSGNGSRLAGTQSDQDLQNLTARQRQVLDHLRLGESNKLIARRLGMTEGTVKVHIRQMMRKCHVANRTQLALGTFTAASASPIANNLPGIKSMLQPDASPFKVKSPVPAHPAASLINPVPRGRPRLFGNN